MWISLFTVVLVIAIAFGYGAMLLDSDRKPPRRYARKRIARARG